VTKERERERERERIMSKNFSSVNSEYAKEPIHQDFLKKAYILGTGRGAQRQVLELWLEQQCFCFASRVGAFNLRF
jgi:hypothetical protein